MSNEIKVTISDVNEIKVKAERGVEGARGGDGKSAYELAVENGFVGTESQWINSLKGEQGLKGDGLEIISIYPSLLDLQTAHPIGIKGDCYAVGTPENNEIYFWDEVNEEWSSIGPIMGPQGIDGTIGQDGKSAYELAVENGFVGTEVEWLASLKGADGNDGIDGTNGQDGKSAYQSALDGGFVGTEIQFNESLADINDKQATLVSGTNIKTINGNSVLGSGDLVISSGVKNQIINGNFQVNQRAKTGTVTLTAGQYGHDRWKAGASGCTYTFATVENITTLTISAGSLIQVVEGLNLETGTYCLSWEGTAQGKIGGGSYGSSGITGSAVGGTNLNIEFNTGTLKKVSFVKGSTPVAFVVQPYADVLRECQRYYRRFGGSQYTPFAFGFHFSTVNFSGNIQLDTPMRIIPTLEFGGGLAVQQSNASYISASTLAISSVESSNIVVNISCTTATGTTNLYGRLIANNDVNAFVGLNAEL